ncbi:hypothetical protein [Streptomyces sp. NPDC047841]|uniref:hypothetical protein n=1 Tax=Streptomyces sp. NPDC047841 TaxID=3154708 RepID=UPI003452D0A2
MTNGPGVPEGGCGSGPLPARGAVPGEAGLTAPPSVRRAAGRHRRLQRVLRTVLHRLGAGAVSRSAAAPLAAVARALPAWHGIPNPPVAAAAPRYGAGPGVPNGVASTPTEAGEALLPGLTAVFGALAAPGLPVSPRSRRRPGPGRSGTRAGSAARPPRARRVDGPDGALPGMRGRGRAWTVTCDRSPITPGCPRGTVTRAHGLAFPEVRPVPPEA